MEISKNDILIVDDDKIVLDSLKQLFELEEIEAAFFDSPQKALEHAKKNSPKVVVSDFLMPNINGIEFLSQVKQIVPNATTILLTGYADKENAIKAINEVGIYKYIEKPWDNDSLILNIKNAIERSNLIQKLQQKVEELDLANTQLEKYSNNLEKIVEEKTSTLQSINQKLNAVISNCADAIFVFDQEGKIFNANEKAQIFSGLSEKILKNKKIDDIVLSASKKQIVNQLDLKKTVLVKNVEIQNCINDSSIPVEINIAPILQENESPLFVSVARNVFAQKELDRMRDDFIATLTHDLRTPLLASIQTLAYFLDGTLGDLNENQTKFLQTMKTSNEEMLGLVNALLEVYRYEAGKLNLYKTKFELNQFIENCIEPIVPLFLQKQVKLVLNLSKTKNMKIEADKNELRRVVVNLCGNALKYTPTNGTVTIESSVFNKKDIRISVQDTGIGIDAKEVPKMFKRFYQCCDKKTSASTGLGLYLSKQIIDAHNGKIWVESMKNQGSKFVFVLFNALCKNVNNKELEGVNL